ncbi:MAG: HTH-type 3 domain-containing protein [Clostridium sp.]
MDSMQTKQIVRLQDNLSVIRRIAGWTTEELGNMIGVTKATISNLENKKSPMTLTQYIAIRTVIDHEIQTNTENTVLPQVVSILLDNDDLSEKEQKELSQKINTVAAAAGGGVSGVALASLFATVAALPFLGVATMPLTITGMWLPKILRSRKKQKDKNKEDNKNG